VDIKTLLPKYSSRAARISDFQQHGEAFMIRYYWDIDGKTRK